MKNKFFRFGIFVLIIGAVLGFSACSSANASEGELVSTEKLYDFGTISMQDGVVGHQFEVTNDGPGSLVIDKVYSTCGCTTASIIDGDLNEHGTFGMSGHGDVTSDASIVVDSGDTIIVDVEYDPAAHGPSGVGMAQRSVYLESNSAESPKLELKFVAMVTN